MEGILEQYRPVEMFPGQTINGDIYQAMGLGHKELQDWPAVRVQEYLALIPGRIKTRPGTYCMGDSAHALQITQNMGNRTMNVKP